MINANSNWKNNPFLLSPAGKDYLWGGTRLKDNFSKELNLTPLAETWECSVHPDGPSTIASGSHKGRLLSDILKAYPDMLGTHHCEKGQLPILIKFIDASKDLSVQVHPDDIYAAENENGENGKTEMWVVLDAAKDASIVYGLHHKIDESKLRKSIENGSIEKYLQKVPIHQGDQFLIQPGTIHAIGAGALIAEIQENSNLTYRLYDYNRVDKNGQKRPLHIDKALDVANLNAMPEPKQPMHIFRYTRGCASEHLCRCRYFQVDRLLINTEQCRNMTSLHTDSLSFQVLLCTKGCGNLTFSEENLPFFKGDCIFIPANSPDLTLHGKAEFLKIIC